MSDVYERHWSQRMPWWSIRRVRLLLQLQLRVRLLRCRSFAGLLSARMW